MKKNVDINQKLYKVRVFFTCRLTLHVFGVTRLHARLDFDGTTWPISISRAPMEQCPRAIMRESFESSTLSRLFR